MKIKNIIPGMIVGCLALANMQPTSTLANDGVAPNASLIMANTEMTQESKQVLWSVVVLNTSKPYDFTEMMAYLTKTYSAGLIEHQNKSIVAFNKHLLTNTPENNILVKDDVLNFFNKKVEIVYSKNLLQEEKTPTDINLRVPYSLIINKDIQSSYINDISLELNGVSDIKNLLIEAQIKYHSGIEHAESMNQNINNIDNDQININDTINMPLDGTLIISPGPKTLIHIQAS